jgi:FKBP-type peptidyl-prolyl cis-trans isomerase
MRPVQTGVAVALALAVVGSYFIFPGLWPFGRTAPEPSTAEATTTEATAAASVTEPNQKTPSMATPIQPITQLMMKDEIVGTGDTAAAGDTVTVQYVGSLTNGTVFDASAKHGTGGFTFKLGAGQVIKGWDQGVAGMKVGGKRILAIPAALAYGSQAVGNVIPANSDLVFEVELVKVQKGQP